MADGRIDDLERRIRDIEATVAGLSAERDSLRDAVDDLAASIPESDTATTGSEGVTGAKPDTGDERPEALGQRSDTAAGSAEYDGTEVLTTPVDGPSGDECGTDDRGSGTAESADGTKHIVMAPPKGASQAAVDEAVDEVERRRRHEENLVM